MSIDLRPYQLECLEAIDKAEVEGTRRQLVALPTGCGKTIIFVELIRQRQGRAIILCHRDELLQQAHEKLLMVMPDADVGVVKSFSDDHDKSIILGSVQTLARERRLQRLAPDFETIIIDEAHHAREGNSYHRILKHLGAFQANGPLTLGVSATPFRSEKHGLSSMFARVVYSKSLQEMICAGYLCDLRAMQIQLSVDFGRLHIRAGDFVEREAEALMRSVNAPYHAVKAYQEHAAGRKALVFTAGVQLAHEMAAAFRAEGIASSAVDASTPPDERRAILQRFRLGEIMVLCNCGILTEGYDEPSVDCIIIARPTRSRLLYTQMIGRSTRLYPGKDDALILDLVGCTNRHDLITAPVLFGLAKKVCALANKSLTEVWAEQEQEKREVPAPEQDGKLISRKVNLFERKTIRLRWLRVSERHFILPLADHGYLVLESPNQEKWQLLKMDNQRIDVISRDLTLEWAQGRGNDLACSLGAGGLNNGHAKWRYKLASEGQKKYLGFLKVPVVKGMTSGEAFEKISIAQFRQQWQKSVVRARQMVGTAR